jgi:Concanavalin A-like lectin/glucanases superfamily
VTGGRYGRALSFNGTNSIVQIANSQALNTGQALTIEAWVRPSALSSWNTVLMKEGTDQIGYGLYAQNDGGRPAGYVNVGFGDNGTSGTTGLAANAWSHLALTYDGNSMKLYVNGQLVSSQQLTGALMSTTGGLSIGGNTMWGEYFNGLIDEVRIYSRALTATEIQTDMNTPV